MARELIPRMHTPLERGPGWCFLYPEGRGREVWVKCSCGAGGTLDHRVAADGTVSPSLVCPGECGWHVHGCVTAHTTTLTAFSIARNSGRPMALRVPRL